MDFEIQKHSSNDWPPSEEHDKLDRWLFAGILVICGWGVFLGKGLQAATGVESLIYAAMSGFLGVWYVRLTDPETPRQLLLVVGVGLVLISLTLLMCACVLKVADSTTVQGLGYLADSVVIALGVGLCSLGNFYAIKLIYPWLGVPLRQTAKAGD